MIREFWSHIFKQLTKAFILMSVFMMSSCVVDSVGSQKAFNPGVIEVEETNDFCKDFYEFSLERGTQNCLPRRCEVGTHIATASELEEIIENLKTSNLNQETIDNFIGNLNEARTVCLDGAGILRPDREITINSKTFCACKDGVSHLQKNCNDFCSTKPTQGGGVVTLFGEVSLSPNVQENLGSLGDWCETPIDEEGPSFNSPQCSIKFTKQDGTSDQVEMRVPLGSNSFEINLSPGRLFNYDTNYVISLIETQSGVETNGSEVRFAEPRDEGDNQGALKRVPVTRYQCLFMAGRLPNVDNYALQHFYFIEREKPDPILPNRPLIRCHDGSGLPDRVDDNPLYRRMAETPSNFMLWDNTDTRMLGSGDSIDLININVEMTNELRRRLNREGDSSVTMNRFFPFDWELRPNDRSDGSGDVQLRSALGMVMSPYIDSRQGNLGVCPGQDEYNSSNIEYNILSEYIQVDTEGVYLAESDPYVASFVDDSGETVELPPRRDIMIVKESDLKRVDFYEQGGARFNPNEATIGSKTINFFFPFDFSGGDAHLIKKGNQTRYTVRFPDRIGSVTVDSLILQDGRPSDKRFACIPKL